MKKILVTGADGFIGTHLIRFLLNKQEAQDNEGAQISTLTRKSNSAPGIAHSYLWGDFDSIKNTGFDIIIHLAGKAHDLKNQHREQQYHQVNFELTKLLFDYHLASGSGKFIFFSSVKAVADQIQGLLDESFPPNPITPYGKSKLLAEQYIMAKAADTNWLILRPCLVHGALNKGNLNLLYKFIKSGVPYPLGGFDNKRSFLSIDNLTFIVENIIYSNIPSGVYNLADDPPISTNELVDIIRVSLGKSPTTLRFNRRLVNGLAAVGDYLGLPFNTERLHKLTQNYMVSNQKITKAIQSELPMTTQEGLMKTFKSFK